MVMPRVAVVGGSIGGLTAAALLRDLGCEVDVYERSRALLSGLGTGIVVQPELVRYPVERAGLALDRISVASSVTCYYQAATGERTGQVPTDYRFTSYDVLYRALLASFDSGRYHLGHALVGIDQDDDRVELRFANGTVVHRDLVVCADGSLSVARQRLLGVLPTYAGYVSWRGLVSRDRVSEAVWSFFDERLTYGLLADSHVVAYPIPVIGDGAIDVIGRQINVLWYWNVPEGSELDELMTDREGYRRPASVHFDAIQRRALDTLGRRARDRLAPVFAELMLAAERPFATVIADTDTPAMAVGRAALIGDAAITGRPHAAAGGAKAAADAWALADALAASRGDVVQALAAWEPARLAQGHALLEKVRRMGEALQHGGPFVPGDPANRFGLPTCSSDDAGGDVPGSGAR